MLPAAQRLPESIIGWIVKLAVHRIWSSGGACIREKIVTFKRLGQVCYHWEKYLNEAHSHYHLFPICPDSDTGELDWAQCIKFVQEGTNCKSCRVTRKTTHRGLKLRISGKEGEGWRKGKTKEFKRLLDQIYRHFHEINQLHLDIESGEDVEIATKITLLNKLLVGNHKQPYGIQLNFPSTLTIASTLVRLDLAQVTIESWSKLLPSVKTLTLDHVVFGRDDSVSTDDLCRDFFSSFPSLNSIGFDGVIRLASTSLAQLKVYGITRLYLGVCCAPASKSSSCHALGQGQDRNFVEALARHFRCRVKHIFFAPDVSSLLLIYLLLSVTRGEYDYEFEAEELERFLFEAGLRHVEWSRWEESEEGDKLSSWEPKIWS
ncbi:hypothetical protein JCM5350_002618 [Sporobolomyces pararoseus]